MTFLELARKLRREAGVSGTSTTPSATTNQTGEMERLVNWINDAWMDIQNSHRTWKWMRSQARVSTTSGDGTYETGDFTDDRAGGAVANFGHWLVDSFSIYLNSIGQSDERELPYMPFDDWKRLYDFGSEASLTDYPVVMTVDPTDSSIRLGRTPNGVYVVRGEFYHCASPLSGDSDEPGMPSQFHDAIVWRALMFYGEYESAPEAYSKGQNNFNRLYSRLFLNQAELPGFGPPLVR